MLRELRTASSVATSSASDVKFTFLDDTATSVTVEYNLNGTNLQRNQTVPPVAGQPDILVGGVTTFAVTSYDINNVATTTAANLYAVHISITTRAHAAAPAAYSPATAPPPVAR